MIRIFALIELVAFFIIDISLGIVLAILMVDNTLCGQDSGSGAIKSDMVTS